MDQLGGALGDEHSRARNGADLPHNEPARSTPAQGVGLNQHQQSGTAAANLTDLIERHGYEFVEDLQRYDRGKVCRVRKGGSHFVIKRTDAAGAIVYRDLLPALSHIKFRRLAVPQFIESGEEKGVGHWVVTEWLDGRTFHDRWDERHPNTSGGRAIPLDTTTLVLDLVADLASINPASHDATAHLCRRTADEVTGTVERKLVAVRDDGQVHVTPAQETLARELIQPLIDSVNTGRVTLSNGDFYFRNFIELPAGRVAVVDWDSTRLSTFEVEHCVAYQWMLMWNNPPWQRAFLDEAKSRFELDRDRFRAVLLLDTLTQVVFWKGQDPYLMQIELDYFLNSLSDSYFSHVWGG
jgi:hypothetical protein